MFLAAAESPRVRFGSTYLCGGGGGCGAGKLFAKLTPCGKLRRSPYRI